MGLVGDPIPTRPQRFAADGAPPGVDVDFEAFRRSDGVDGSWFKQRPIIRPITLVVHTNAASIEGSLQSQVNWSNGDRNNTHAHYNVNAPKPTKHCPTDRRGIGNSSGQAVTRAAGVRHCSFWSIVVETADSGTRADPKISDFLFDHAEIVARILAYESIVWNIPLAYPEKWTQPGTISHTKPFPFPFFTTQEGKTCPGDKKKARLESDILPRAKEIRAAWLGQPAPDETAISGSDVLTDSATSTIAGSFRDIKSIKKGDTGREVGLMQHMLAAAGYLDETDPDNYGGIWDDDTDRAKERFDVDHGLHTPGDTSCGSKSWESLATRRHW